MADTQILDVSERTFSLLPDQMAVGRSDIGCMVLEREGLLIAAGGADVNWDRTPVVEILDMNEGRWHSANALPIIGRVWATHGFIFMWFSPVIYQYEPGSDQWLKIDGSPLPLGTLPVTLSAIDAGTNKLCQFK